MIALDSPFLFCASGKSHGQGEDSIAVSPFKNLRRWLGYIPVYYNSYFVQNWYIGGHPVATIVSSLSKMNETTLVVDSISDFECYKIEQQTCL